jgi:hypothetical protein
MYRNCAQKDDAALKAQLKEVRLHCRVAKKKKKKKSADYFFFSFVRR